MKKANFIRTRIVDCFNRQRTLNTLPVRKSICPTSLIRRGKGHPAGRTPQTSFFLCLVMPFLLSHKHRLIATSASYPPPSSIRLLPLRSLALNQRSVCLSILQAGSQTAILCKSLKLCERLHSVRQRPVTACHSPGTACHIGTSSLSLRSQPLAGVVSPMDSQALQRRARHARGLALKA